MKNMTFLPETELLETL